MPADPLDATTRRRANEGCGRWTTDRPCVVGHLDRANAMKVCPPRGEAEDWAEAGYVDPPARASDGLLPFARIVAWLGAVEVEPDSPFVPLKSRAARGIVVG